ncbi:MAG: SurA N-terminal domain-containing protein [Burkholderiaceae bacterium]
MFDSIRSHRRWLMFFMLVLIFPSFVFFGIQGYNRFIEGENAVARISGKAVSVQELEAAQRERLEQLRQMFGSNFDAKLFDTPEARAATLDALLSERALALEAATEHLLVTEERLREVIASVPAFQRDGKFDYERYKTLLAAQALSERAFEQRVRDDLVRQTLLQAVADSTFLPGAVAERLLHISEEQRAVRELRFRPEDFAARVKVNDEAIAAYYEANRREFESPESVKAEYVVLTLDDVAAQLAVPEENLKAYYEQNKAAYGQPEERRASHILLTAGEGGSASDKAGARKRAEELLARLRKNPGDFAQLAREFSKDPGSAAKGGDLGFFGRNMMVKPFEDAAFALKPGEISDVVETDFGFHIIRVDEVKPATYKSFEAVRADIEREYRRQRAQKTFAEAVEQFTNTVYEQADSLKPVADKLKLQIQTVDRLTREGVPAQPGAPQIFTPRLVQALFSEDSIKRKRNTEAIDVAPNTFVSARVVEHRPAALRPLAEVRDQIRTRLERQEAARLAREAGAAKLEALRKSPNDAGFAPVRTVSRAAPEGLPPAAIRAIMQAPADKLPAFVGAELDGGAYAVFEIVSAKLPDKPDPQRREFQQRAWQQQTGAADDLAYLTLLKRKHKAQVVDPALKSAGAVGEATKK